ncbi:MAG: crotonase/enoyl-CoA hydratase family protein [Pseudomonadales bacterium]|nr:crotonase/enoyl-CoA hydratase family protein [Pseudomonadales bacterium]
MTVLIDQKDDITIITINRPEAKNAVDRPTAEALAKALKDFDDDDTQNVAILTGATTFCAGADLKAIATGEGNRIDKLGDGPMGPSRMQLSKPVIAAIEGYAVAGGLELAAWCDMRVAASDATLGVFCRRFGVPLIDGGTVRLPRLIGMSRAMDLILTGRPVGAEEALQIGLVNRLAPSGEAINEALKLAKQIAGFPQTCMRNDRLSAYQQWNMSESDAIVAEFELGVKVIESGETVSGAGQFAQGIGRHGQFKDNE